MKINFSHVGKLVGKGRPKFSTFGGYVHTYTPKKTREYEQEVVNSFYKKHGRSFKPLVNPLKVKIIAYHQIPKNTSKNDTKLMLSNVIKPTKKPDIDNISKIILDALNGVAYKDDNQIVELRVLKKYYSISGILVEIEEIEKEDPAQQLELC